MKYQCGHEACDICGGASCRKEFPAELRKYGDYVACDSCARQAVRLAYDASATFGGGEIDPRRKPCRKEHP